MVDKLFTLNEVLAQLRDPWALLRRHAAALAEEGVVLLCMPNAEHWSLAERLLRGSWDYPPPGPAAGR